MWTSPLSGHVVMALSRQKGYIIFGSRSMCKDRLKLLKANYFTLCSELTHSVSTGKRDIVEKLKGCLGECSVKDRDVFLFRIGPHQSVKSSSH